MSPTSTTWSNSPSPISKTGRSGCRQSSGPTAGSARLTNIWTGLIALVAPPGPPSAPPSSGPLDIPNAVGYLDAVWKSRTGSHLFVDLDPASVAHLTLACGSEEEFNSFMSALADVLGRVAKPGTTDPPQRCALEQVRDWLVPAGRGRRRPRGDCVRTLIRLRHIRVSTQHADARHKAVDAFRENRAAVSTAQLGPCMDAHCRDGTRRTGRAARGGQRRAAATVATAPPATLPGS